MQIIPVIDLLNGIVVHAKQGQRQHYLPIQSLLTSSSHPIDIIAALLDVYPFSQLYIADLNAIQKLHGNHMTNYSVVETIIRRFPTLKLWADAGINNQHEWDRWSHPNITKILGSENFSTIANFNLLHENSHLDYVLSLDFMPDGYKGPQELISQTDYWPRNVIVMSLAKVGSHAGIDKEKLDTIRKICTNTNFYAAGGVRNIDDLMLLREMKIQGALVASALHSKAITTRELEIFMQQKSPN